MSDLIAELLSTARTSKDELIRENALDLLRKLAEDGLRGAWGAVAAIENAKRGMATIADAIHSKKKEKK
jgi:hypothetical protein